MSYSDYGLDEVKKSVDEGGKGYFYCPWCQNSKIEKGFSLCFSNFCICLDCINCANGNKERWKKDDGNGCFKCSKGIRHKKEFDKLFYDKVGILSICSECLVWGKEVLVIIENYLTEMVQEILKKCTVEGNVVKLPEEKIERKVYLEVAKKLELIGGKWKGHKIQGFVFEEDPTELLLDLANGDDRNLKKEYQFFPTPKDIAREMALLLRPMVTKETKWLEPSAGDGALIKAVVEVYSETFGPLKIDCFELMELNRKKLEKVESANLFAMEDFLKAVEFDVGMEAHLLIDSYDIIIANPPFTKNQDIDHIRAMYKCLKPGGTILTIASQSWYTGSQKKQVEFKQWLEGMGVFPVTLPVKSFQESGTNITPLRLMIQKPVEAKLELSNISLPVRPEHIEAALLTEPAMEEVERTCRVCGCTEDDCSQCIEKAGEACYWFDEDLCSACVTDEQRTVFNKLGSALLSDISKKKEESSTSVQECDATKAAQVEEPATQTEPSITSAAELWEQLSENEKEIQGSLHELKQILSPTTTKMNFFQQLYPLVDGIDVTIRIRRVSGTLRLEVIPQTGGTIRPAVIAGTPEDLDEGFFQAIAVPVQKAKGLKLELDEFHKSTVAAKDDAEKAKREADKQKEEAQKASKKVVVDKKPDAKKSEDATIDPGPADEKKEPVKKAKEVKAKPEPKQKIVEPSLFG